MRGGGIAASAAALLLAGCANQQTQVASATPPAPDASAITGASAAPDQIRWLYGSGEAAGLSIQTYRMLATYAIAAARAQPAQSVPMGLPDAPGGISTVSCTNTDGSRKPPAAVFDVDETLILNRGYEYQTALGHPFDPKTFNDWARNGAAYVAPVPGAVPALRALRDAGVAVIFNTNRDVSSATGTEAALDKAGLGPAKHGDTLYLSGDDALGSNKDGRRATIANRFCVVALAGDNLGDFANYLNDKTRSVQARRALVARGPLAQLWGDGWFALPNPVYGDSIRGSVDDVFPPDARWQPAAPTSTAPSGK